MQAMSLFRKRLLKAAAILIAIAAAFYYLIFYDRMDFDDDDSRCYSPNHEFYVLGKISVYTSFMSNFIPSLRHKGTAKLYDKTGKLLFSVKGVDLYNGGPYWPSRWPKNTEVQFGNIHDMFGFKLPSSPGDSEHYWLNCY
jgi:hypothetical protein